MTLFPIAVPGRSSLGTTIADAFHRIEGLFHSRTERQPAAQARGLADDVLNVLGNTLTKDLPMEVTGAHCIPEDAQGWHELRYSGVAGEKQCDLLRLAWNREDGVLACEQLPPLVGLRGEAERNSQLRTLTSNLLAAAKILNARFVTMELSGGDVREAMRMGFYPQNERVDRQLMRRLHNSLHAIAQARNRTDPTWGVIEGGLDRAKSLAATLNLVDGLNEPLQAGAWGPVGKCMLELDRENAEQMRHFNDYLGYGAVV